MKRSITLLEILIVISLLGLIAGLFSVRFYGRRESFFFSKNYEKLQEKIVFVKKMALFNQRDFFLEMQEEEGRFSLRIYSQKERFENKGKAQIFSPFYFRFLTKEGNEAKAVELICSPKGGFYPEGILEVSQKADFLESRKIILE